PEIVACPHAEAVREEIRETENDRDARRQSTAIRSGNDGEGGYTAVNAAEDGVGEVFIVTALAKPNPGRFGSMPRFRAGCGILAHRLKGNRKARRCATGGPENERRLPGRRPGDRSSAGRAGDAGRGSDDPAMRSGGSICIASCRRDPCPLPDHAPGAR